MIIFNEYRIPNIEFKESKEHIELYNKISKAIDDIHLDNVNNIKIFLSIVYYRKWDKHELFIRNYNKNDFTKNDDIQISVLRAIISTILNDYEDNRICGINFLIELSFGDNPNDELPNINNNIRNIDKEKENENNEQRLIILPTNPRFDFKQMVLPDRVKNDLEDVITLVKLRKKIYEDWGFNEIDPIPRAIINFYGPAGTGKTMAAHSIANEFGIKILALNYADIESKYVGDAPKNLMAAFKIAKENNALLFFDEADSFLGKRISNVMGSSDQAVNSLRSQLLILLEEFEGIVIFATNLIENYDKAFNSRILKHIKFELPTSELRKSLIYKMIPEKMPLQTKITNEDIEYLVELSEGFSGREIKNAILNGIVSSAKTKDAFAIEDGKKSFEYSRDTNNDLNSKNNNLKEKLTKK